MDILIGILSAWFILSIFPVFKYHRIKRELENEKNINYELQRKLLKFDDVSKELDAARSKCISLKQRISSLENRPPVPPPLSTPNVSASNVSAPIITPAAPSIPPSDIAMSDECYRIEYIKSYSEERIRIWGDFFKRYGRILGTLNEDQQRLIHYPSLDPYEVYYSSSGRAYHAVDYCYTLDKSFDIVSCSLEEAKKMKLHPCSKCVQPHAN